MEISNLTSPDFFTDIRSVRKAKKHWIKLIKENHPNIGGSIEILQKINFQYFNWQNTKNPEYKGKKWEADITEYIKILEKTFSDSNWLIYIQHPQIVEMITLINGNNKWN